jgi:hypothetical protein
MHKEVICIRTESSVYFCCVNSIHLLLLFLLSLLFNEPLRFAAAQTFYTIFPLTIHIHRLELFSLTDWKNKYFANKHKTYLI